MSGVQDLIERLKYADAELKKKVVLGAVAGVLFLAAAVFLIRGLAGPAPAEAPEEAQATAEQLRDQLAGEQQTIDAEADAEPFQRGGVQAPPN